MENQVLELKNRIGVLQSVLDRRKGSEDFNRGSIERKAAILSPMIVSDLEETTGPHLKVKSRTFNSSRQANRSTLVVSSSQQKTAV